MKLLELVEHMSERLERGGVAFGHGTRNSFDEAAWLTLWKLGLPLDHLEAESGREVGPDEQAAVDALVDERIRTRKPAAYLTGEAWLQGLPFTVDERVIVPRSLIAELLYEGLLDPWLPAGATRALDLCTGSGCLAVLAALVWPDLKVDAIDISPAALEVARINVGRHDMASRIRLLQGDGLSAADGRYDLILCNPPYVNDESMASLPAEYRAEPDLALAGGRDGMDFIRRLIAGASAHLTAGGALVLEIGHEIAHFDAAFPQLAPVWLPTSAGHEQVLVLTREELP